MIIIIIIIIITIIMTNNNNKDNRTPGKGSLRKGGWEGTRKMHVKLPGTTLCLKHTTCTLQRYKDEHKVCTT